MTLHSVTIGTDVDYAQIHNEGGVIKQGARTELFQRNRVSRGKRKGRFKRGTTNGQGITFGEKNINMPKRQFMGMSKRLDKNIDQLIEKGIKDIFK